MIKDTIHFEAQLSVIAGNPYSRTDTQAYAPFEAVPVLIFINNS